jgi:hypothetical protein
MAGLFCFRPALRLRELSLRRNGLAAVVLIARKDAT